VTDIDWNKVYAGLPAHDWRVLKDLVLAAAHGDTIGSVPPHLLDHEAAQRLRVFARTRDYNILDSAAEALCPLYPGKAWLLLEKS
jgi:hypothetical protein